MASVLGDQIRKSTIQAAKKFAFQHTSLAAPQYSYCVEPIQLATLIYEMDRLKSVGGCIVEHLVRNDITDTNLYAIDTFSSFTEDDLSHEVNVRGKSLASLRSFEYND
jgi:hypothetical protein